MFVTGACGLELDLVMASVFNVSTEGARQWEGAVLGTVWILSGWSGELELPRRFQVVAKCGLLAHPDNQASERENHSPPPFLHCRAVDGSLEPISP